jgi:hypothetical protein
MKVFIYGDSQFNQHNNGVILYRSGNTKPSVILNSDRGVFFSTDPAYFVNHSQMDFPEETRKYLLSPTAKVWDPAKEFELYEADSWSNIVCLMTDLEKFGIEDECDYEIEEKYGVTSTDGLAIAGKNLGYDATVIRNIWYRHGAFDEYAVYNPSVIKPLY